MSHVRRIKAHTNAPLREVKAWLSYNVDHLIREFKTEIVKQLELQDDLNDGDDVQLSVDGTFCMQDYVPASYRIDFANPPGFILLDNSRTDILDEVGLAAPLCEDS